MTTGGDDGAQWQAEETGSGRARPPAGRLALTLAILLAGAVFAADLLSPRGIADGVGYVALVLLCLWMPWPRAPWLVALAATTLTVAGYLLSTPSADEWMGWTNRALTIGAVWIAALFMQVHRNAQRRLHDDEMQLRAISETSPDAILITDANGVIERANRACVRLFGYAETALAGRSIDTLLYNDKAAGPLLSASLATGAASAGSVTERSARRADGTVFPVQLSAGQALLHDRPAVTVFIRDISQQRASEQKIQELQAQLSCMARRSELGGMASAIAHEVNQPLAALRTYLAVARRAQRAPSAGAPVDVDEIMGKAMQQVDTAAEVIRHILRLLGGGDVERSLEDLETTIREAAGFALIGTQRMAIDVSMDLAQGLPPCLMNRVQIQQVLINLIRNSVDAMATRPQRKLAVRMRRRNDSQAEVEVTDTGGGLPREVEEKLFMPFVTSKPHGIGIGLSIAQSIVEAHGGTITATSVPGQGTTFRFSLPLVRSTPG